jgi:hypothetical protein
MGSYLSINNFSQRLFHHLIRLFFDLVEIILYTVSVCLLRCRNTRTGSLLYGLEELIEEKTGINTMTAEDPMTAVAVGTGKFVEFLAGKRDDE